jgi:glycosyltransferase involved in cell wall biosynthesis
MTERTSGRLCVVMVAPPWYEVPPETYGGIENVVAGLTDQLVDAGHEIYLLGTGRDLTRARFLPIYAEPPAPGGSGTLPELVQAAAAGRLLDELTGQAGVRPDVVHDHSLAGPLQARARDVPTIVTMHWPAVGELAWYFEELGDTIGLVAISDSQCRLAPRLPWIATIHNGIDVSAFEYCEVKEDYVAFLGRYGPEKAPHLAIDAAREAGLPIRLAGKCSDPPELEYYDEYVAPRNGPGVEHMGQLALPEKARFLGRARCLVFPICWEEPFGLVLAEALACGTPVVALGRGSVPEVIEHGVTGFVCSDPGELPAAIRDAKLLDPATCRKRAEERFDLPVMVRAYEDLYRRVAA